MNHFSVTKDSLERKSKIIYTIMLLSLENTKIICITDWYKYKRIPTSHFISLLDFVFQSKYEPVIQRTSCFSTACFTRPGCFIQWY